MALDILITTDPHGSPHDAGARRQEDKMAHTEQRDETLSAILDQSRQWIEVVGWHDADVTDAEEIGDWLGWPDTTIDLRRVVWLPGGGEIGDYVVVDDDGIATVVADPAAATKPLSCESEQALSWRQHYR